MKAGFSNPANIFLNLGKDKPKTHAASENKSINSQMQPSSPEKGPHVRAGSSIPPLQSRLRPSRNSLTFLGPNSIDNYFIDLYAQLSD
jgi:hypothetical protein